MVAFRFLGHFICSLEVIGGGLENIGLIITGFNHGGSLLLYPCKTQIRLWIQH